ncbi:MAG: hypothetical protein IPK07_29395 [Deltaproteobacteria bacterium]|nr:hypothetical protein [Deltaproteobacteria bacterium]
MHAWSALALRSLRWIEALVADRERRDDLLARIQAPEVRALEGIAADLAALSAELPLAELTGLESWKSVEERLQVLPDGERRCAALRAFLAAHGHRGPGERTLAGARLSDGPHVLRVMAGEGGFPRRPPRRPSPDARSAGSILMWLDPLEWWVGVVAALGRFAIRRRVAARERATRGLGALRASLLVIGDELVVRDALASREDVFLLTLPEWRALLEAATDVRPVLERRRRAFGADASSPARAVVGAPETHRGPVDPGARVLRGVATSAGVARGRAIGPGRASMTGHTGPEARVLVLDDANPAHAGSLGSVAALVCERGGLLSHLAIVARELGLPAVMGSPTQRGCSQPAGGSRWMDVAARCVSSIAPRSLARSARRADRHGREDRQRRWFRERAGGMHFEHELAAGKGHELALEHVHAAVGRGAAWIEAPRCERARDSVARHASFDRDRRRRAVPEGRLRERGETQLGGETRRRWSGRAGGAPRPGRCAGNGDHPAGEDLTREDSVAVATGDVARGHRTAVPAGAVAARHDQAGGDDRRAEPDREQARGRHAAGARELPREGEDG